MSMWHRKVIAGIALVASPVLAFAGQQPPAGQTPPSAQPPATAAIGECAQAQPRLMQTIDAANTRLEAARLSNSPAAMRAAMDDLQGALGSLRAQLASCGALQAVAPADAHAGHAMPGGTNVQQSPVAQPGSPVMQPGSTRPAPGAVNPNAPASAAGAPADPHAGHTTPAPAPATPPAQPRQQPPPQGAQPQGAAPAPSAPAAAADGHAGHGMPVAANVPMLRDPRCTAAVNPESAPRAEYAGQAYYFCSERDRQVFVADPAKYLQSAVGEPVSGARAATRASTPPRTAAPAAADPHAGHVMPGAAQSAAPARGSAPATQQPATRPQSATPAPSAGEHAGHTMPSAPQPGGTTGRSSAPAAGSAPAPAGHGNATSAPATPAHAAAPLSSGRMPVIAVTELKCDGRVEPKTAPRMLHQGRMYYFCSVEERAEFAKNPQKYVTTPPVESAPAHAH